MERKQTAVVWAALTLAAMLFPAGGYVTGYYLRSTTRNYAGTVGPILVREYPTELEANLFGPAAKIESSLTGWMVSTRPAKNSRHS